MEAWSARDPFAYLRLSVVRRGTQPEEFGESCLVVVVNGRGAVGLHPIRILVAECLKNLLLELGKRETLGIHGADGGLHHEVHVSCHQ